MYESDFSFSILGKTVIHFTVYPSKNFSDRLHISTNTVVDSPSVEDKYTKKYENII
jgi:hypothetical protein